MMELGRDSPKGNSDAASQPLVSFESPYRSTTEVGRQRSRLNLYTACAAGKITR